MLNALEEEDGSLLEHGYILFTMISSIHCIYLVTLSVSLFDQLLPYQHGVTIDPLRRGDKKRLLRDDPLPLESKLSRLVLDLTLPFESRLLWLPLDPTLSLDEKAPLRI